jgi:hypothetical protein
LDAPRVGEEQHARLAVVPRVQDHAAVVGIARDVVPVGEGRPDLAGIRVLELEACVEELVVVGEIADVAHLGRNVVAGVRLEPRIDARRIAPSVVVEAPVHRDTPREAVDLEGDPLRLGGRCGDRAEQDRTEHVQRLERETARGHLAP